LPKDCLLYPEGCRARIHPSVKNVASKLQIQAPAAADLQKAYARTNNEREVVLMASIPAELYRDRYWAPVIHLFTKHPKLKSCFTTKYFDIQGTSIKFQALKRASSQWSTSEKIMLQLALHLFNERNKFNLSDIDYLDDRNRLLAFEAMKMRFGK
jgi:hypothetical protein